MLAAIDAIAVQLCRAGCCAEAIDAALVAVTADPLRNSSQAALITGTSARAISARAAGSTRPTAGSCTRSSVWSRRSGWRASSGSGPGRRLSSGPLRSAPFSPSPDGPPAAQ
jgi:hypothetical protein